MRKLVFGDGKRLEISNLKVKGLHDLYSKKSTDLLPHYHVAVLHLSFLHMRKAGFFMTQFICTS